MAVQGHAKGVPVKDVGSMEYGAFGGRVEGHAKPAPVDWTPQTLVPKESKKPEIVKELHALLEQSKTTGRSRP